MYVNVQHKNVNLLTKKSQCLTGIERFFGINNCKTPGAELLSTPTKDMPNRVGKLKKGVELERTGVDDKFSRVTYNGKTVYIANDEIMVLSS